MWGWPFVIEGRRDRGRGIPSAVYRIATPVYLQSLRTRCCKAVHRATTM